MDLEIFKLIFEHTEDKNPTDEKGLTLLHFAVHKGNFEMCKLILDNVQEKNPSSSNGLTPLQVALNNNHQQIAKYIQSSIFRCEKGV